MGFTGHNQALTRIYQSGRVHIDIGRLYQADIVTMRVFDLLACGGFLIAEHSHALTDLFQPGVHLETWRTIGELREKAAHFMQHPDQAARIAAQGLQRVRAEHTIRKRVGAMLDDLRAAAPVVRFVV
jgi:spore maturation protein CgeB